MTSGQNSTVVEEEVGASYGRLRVQTVEGRVVYVNGFASMMEATSWGKALKRCKRLVQSVAVQRKEKGSWKPAKTLLVVLLCVASFLTGCASALRGPLSTSYENEQYDADKVIADRICLKVQRPTIWAAKAACFSLYPIVRESLANGVLAGQISGTVTGAVRIELIRALYQPGAERLRSAVYSHEIAHLLLRHGFQEKCRTQRDLCEAEADSYSVTVLQMGWGVSEAEAVQIVFDKLLRRVGHAGRHGHKSGCEEIADWVTGHPGAGLVLPEACKG